MSNSNQKPLHDENTELLSSIIKNLEASNLEEFFGEEVVRRAAQNAATESLKRLEKLKSTLLEDLREIADESDAKAEAREAAALEIKAAEIDYARITGIQTSYSLACNEMDRLIADAVLGKEKETHIHYEPPKGVWGPTMDAYLPQEQLRTWQETKGSNPIQLKTLRSVIFTMLTHTKESPLWWTQQKQITLTLSQIEHEYWHDNHHKATQRERDLLVNSLSLLVNTRFESKYPAKDKKKRHEDIDIEQLVHEGITLLPAQFVRGVNASGHVVNAENAALQFHALPPLDVDADKLREVYKVPFLDGSIDGLAPLDRIEATTIDVEYELVKYIRMAVETGRATGYVKSIARITNSNEYRSLEKTANTVVAQAKFSGASREEMDEAMAKRKQAQQRLAKIRMRVKKDIKRVLPILISNERKKKHYLTVTTTDDRQGFVITRVKPKQDPKTKKLIEPPYVFEF